MRRHRPPPPDRNGRHHGAARAVETGAEALPEPVFAVIDEAEREETASSPIVSEMIDDPDAAFRTDAVLYQDFLVRCRIRRLPG